MATLLALAALLLYLLTLAPGVISLNDDTLEFQLVAVRGAIPHPTGYPLYALLLTLFTRLIPIGDFAWRANLLSALLAAAAVGFTYLAARALLPAPHSRLPAVVAAGLFALTPTFWAHATVAEVYALHYLLMAALLWRALLWLHSVESHPFPPDILLLLGLGLAHHRMMALWLPALGAVWAFWRLKRAIRLPTPPQIGVGLLAFLVPLALYLWLPLRSDVGSIDGSYQQVGFSCWVTACQYGDFFSANPLERPREPLFFLWQVRNELSAAGLLLALVGLVRLIREPRAVALFVLIGLVTHALFAQLYRVPDPEVFGLPLLWIAALLAGVGAAALPELLESGAHRFQRDPQPVAVLQRAVPRLLLAALGVLLLSRLFLGWQAADRSGFTGYPTLNGVPFNGYDALQQPLPVDGVVVGLLGEITYLRYLQEAEGVAPQVQMAGGDDPAQRIAAIEAALLVGNRPYLTRELAGLENRYSLSALGPLIEVYEMPRPRLPDGLFPLEQNVTNSIALAGWTRSPVPGSAKERLTIAWRVRQPIVENLHLSARLVGEGGALVCADCQQDRPPVRNAYPTSAWRVGEIILDTYELPAPPPGSHYLLIFYQPDSGAEVGRAAITP